jgi:RNA polymerase sigma-70 factor (ECF subfamily)
MLSASDAEWVERLTGQEREAATKELQHLLNRAMFKFDVSAEDKEDFVQSATIAVLTKISSYQGRSKFSTWAISIAINTALSELRKRHWNNVSLEDLTQMQEPIENSSSRGNPELEAQRQSTIELVDSLIHGELTLKQRTALLAELNGMPLQEIASRMGVSRGAIYKLTFDARQKLLQCLTAKGYSLDDLTTAMEQE